MAETVNAQQTSAARRLWPGLVVAVAGTAASMSIAVLVPAGSSLTWAVVLGVVVGNLPLLPGSVRPGLAWTVRRSLRLGVVLLGLQLPVGQVLGLGAGTVVAVVVVVAVTFLGTVLLGRCLGVSRGLSLLVATGFSICGASAIAAVEGVVDRKDEDVATAVALVTVFGSLSMLLLPVLGAEWGLSDAEFGRIAGAGVHEVAQVVAAASPVGGAAVAIAIVVKLSRVVLLAPVVAIVGVARRRDTAAAGGKRPPLLPLFVVGFLVAVVVRSLGVLPPPVLHGAQQVTAVLLTAALFALGSAVRVADLVRTGPKAFVLGAVSTVLVTGTAFAGMLALT